MAATTLDLINATFRALPMVILVALLFLSCVCGSTVASIAMAGYTVNFCVLWTLKRSLHAWNPRISTRPSTSTRSSCGMFENGIGEMGTSDLGMPSGHCQATAFLAAFVATRLCLQHQHHQHQHQNGGALALALRLAVLAALVGYQAYTRVVVYECHTAAQAVAGVLVGIAVGVLTAI